MTTTITVTERVVTTSSETLNNWCYPVTPFLDDFNRPDGPLGILWESPWGLPSEISSSKMVASGTVGNPKWHENYSNNFEIYFDFDNILDGGSYVGIYIYYADSDNYLFISYTGLGDLTITEVYLSAGSAIFEDNLDDATGIGVRLKSDKTIAVYLKKDGEWILMGKVGFNVSITGDSAILEQEDAHIDNFGGGTYEPLP